MTSDFFTKEIGPILEGTPILVRNNCSLKPYNVNHTLESKTLWKIEKAHAIFWMYLDGTAQRIFFFFGIKLFCFSR